MILPGPSISAVRSLHLLRLFLLCLGGCLLSSCTPQWLFQHQDIPNQAPLPPPLPTYEHLIQPDDKINLSVWGHDDLGVGSAFSVYSSSLEQGKYISVDQEGQISLPLIGVVKLSGLTAREANLYLTRLYKKYIQNPIVYLRILSHQVTILGEVNSPGNFFLPKQRSTLIELIGEASGFTNFADKRQIRIIRTHQNQEKEEIEVDLTLYETLYDSKLFLQNEDLIYIPERRAKRSSEFIGTNLVPIVGVIGSLALVLSLLNSNN
ncbi:MAG: polysaccharide biosynthesis/export family protein [Bacteroidota bacterium]